MPLLHRLRHSPLGEKIVEAHYRGTATERPLLYTLRAMTGSQPVAWCRPRGCDFDVLIRHNTSDGHILQEFVMFRIYDPPPEVDRVLRELRRPFVIADLGAHIGFFGAWFLSLYPGSEIIGFEPDSKNFALLELTARRTGRNWRVLNNAAWTEDAMLRFSEEGGAESHVDIQGNSTVHAVDVFPYLQRADLLKIDIEGSEWQLLVDPRFDQLPARAIILEWHPSANAVGDPGERAKQLLVAAGFETLQVPGPPGAPPDVGMTWGWRS